MFTSYTCGFFDVWFLHLNSGQLLSGKLTVSELSYTFAMPSRSFQRQRRPLTFSWTQCSSLTPSLTVGGSCKHSSLSVKTLPKPFMYRYFLLSSWFRLNWMILCRLFFFNWQHEDMNSNLEQVPTPLFSIGSHEATHAWGFVDRLWLEHTELNECYV